ncbi:iron-containing alcohol dehydrogenase [Salimicrobium halophilum]|uniref:Alcohol dehydrogenase, class IV n=1 Tax=Salimicrobium halophilum TaxID=86666 RepID=A0A1G8S5B0_9BACI|nr:iron-containing alcohol dehydrogenase [Salimicrobium halophilum]SDJ23850.1 Alcohol dehydrogenase, class IV [Salimicrobium halophilum]
MISPWKAIRYRSFQRTMHVSSRFLPWRRPDLIEGEHSTGRLVDELKKEGYERVLIVTDKGIKAAGLLAPFEEELNGAGIEYIRYEDTVPNPTVINIQDALHAYRYHHCQAIIGFGGGSAIDCAKGVAAKVARPDKTIEEMKGLFRVRRATPMLIAIPTTSGTGSEGTAATVISNPETSEKYPLIDLSLIPDKAVLDVSLVLDLPQHITAMTGMDALTHAIEAYIGKSNTKETELLSRKAVRLIFGNLLTTYHHPHDKQARAEMQKAAYYAGLAFTKAYVGYVHSIAHTLGGFYRTPHGLANAVLLPHILDYYGESIHVRLANLADSAGITTSGMNTTEKAEIFIEAIRKLNREMEIPTHIPDIKQKDIPDMVRRSMKEAHPLYPVPVFMNEKDMTAIYTTVST